MNAKGQLPLLFALLASGANAAEPVPIVPSTGMVVLLTKCPSELKDVGPQSSAAILAALGLAVVKNVAVAAAAAFAGMIEKRNKDLSAVSTFEGFGWFYGPDRINAAGVYNPKGKDGTVAGCIVVVRYGNLREDAVFSSAIGAQGADALSSAGITAAYASSLSGSKYIATPDFYAELKLEPAEAALSNANPVAFGFRLKPNLVYYGRSAAKAGRDHAKTLRLELSLYRYELDKGQLADKAYYMGGFDLDRRSQGTLLTVGDPIRENRLKSLAGPLASYPVPSEIKAGSLQLVSSGSVSPGATISDPAMFALQAKFIETEDPSLLMKAIASAVADNKTKIEEVATSAALKAVQGLSQ